MAKSRGPITQPGGGKVTVSDDERVRWKAKREALGLDQEQLGKKVGASQGTISNMENGKHPQIKRSVYANLRRVLDGSTDVGEAPADEAFKRVVDQLVDLRDADMKAVSVIIDALKKK